jgi:hypothetical protein
MSRRSKIFIILNHEKRVCASMGKSSIDDGSLLETSLPDTRSRILPCVEDRVHMHMSRFSALQFVSYSFAKFHRLSPCSRKLYKSEMQRNQ